MGVVGGGGHTHIHARTYTRARIHTRTHTELSLTRTRFRDSARFRRSLRCFPWTREPPVLRGGVIARSRTHGLFRSVLRTARDGAPADVLHRPTTPHTVHYSTSQPKSECRMNEGRKENVLFNDPLNTF